ncbi:AAA-like domain-containing protein [Acaryochloris sp. IP29b_bin.137]|uniref:WD40 domain-containing protein n=1 Tax=Acaryochloris sp. IP29b_bin.137 TaxID=2969217 RepID=UPI0026158808|nr:AAA-like domain-containing protein [Acaryochloris sp. IP29b_bin.137]
MTPTALAYKVGGSLGYNHPSYVIRQADTELLNALLNGDFCYVFNSRQMGKSSLKVRAMHQLAQDHRCVSIDMTVTGSQVQGQQWYASLIVQLCQGLALSHSLQLKPWFQDHAHLPPVQQLQQFIEDVLAQYLPNNKIFIFIDEIDKTLSLPFIVDDFFALIRWFYNQRAENDLYKRLTVALFGVATPADLIQDKTQTLFNIGHAIELTGFTATEAQPLVHGLPSQVDHGQAVVREILEWTGGQPFLTQKLCQLVTQLEVPIPAGQEQTVIAGLVRSQIIDHWPTQDEPVHLRTIRDRLRHPPDRTGQLLGLYRRILDQETVVADGSVAQGELQLSGLVVKRQGVLRVYNRIYQAIFNHAWIEQELASLRPYAAMMQAWEASEREDTSRLLRGKALQDALDWSQDQQLSNQDYQYLAASQALDKQIALETERKARDLERLSTQLDAEKRAKQALAKAYADAKRKLRLGTGILTLSLIGAIATALWINHALQQQRIAQTQSIEWAGKSALQQFDFDQVVALLTAMEAVQNLQPLVRNHRSLHQYPTTTPVIALQEILQHIWERNRLEGHEATVNSLSFSPDGQSIATASRDGTVRLWNLQGQTLQILSGHQGDVYNVVFSPDGQRLATAAKDGTLRLWTLAGETLQVLRGHQEDVYDLSWSPDSQLIASASKDGTAIVFDRYGKEYSRFTQHQDSVYAISFSPDSQRIATTSRDSTIRIWTITGEPLAVLRGHQGAVFDVAFSPDGQQMVTAGADQTVRLWTETGQPLQVLRGHQGAVYDVSFNATGQWLASASGDKTIRLWSAAGQSLQVLRGHQGAVFSAKFSPQGNLLATASNDETNVHLWQVRFNALEQQQRHMQRRITSLGFSMDGRQRVTAWNDGEIEIGKNLQSMRKLKGGLKAISSLSFHPPQQLLAAATKQGKVQLYQRDQPISTFVAHPDTIYSVQISFAGDRIGTASRDETLKLWSPNGQQQAVLKGHQGAVYSLRFSPDDQQILSTSSDGTARLWSRQGQLLAQLQGHQGAVYDGRFSPDGHTIATAAEDGRIRLWTTQGQLIRAFRNQPSSVYRLRFSPDGQRVAAGSTDGNIQIWDLQGNLQMEFDGHAAVIQDLSFDLEGQQLTTVASDGSVQVWPLSASPQQHLETLMQRGCRWLADYLINHPQPQLSSCPQPAKRKPS